MAAIVSILGPIGAGKTAQAERLAQEEGWQTFSTGQLIREDDNPEIQKQMEQGNLVSTEYAQELVLKRIRSIDSDSGIVLDGSPRMLPEAERLDAELPTLGRKLGAIVFLQVGNDEASQRLQKRGRLDDQPDIMAVRRAAYERDTVPVIGHYRQLGVPILEVDGAGEVEAVHHRVVAALKEVGIV